jgi:hypothetical protein
MINNLFDLFEQVSCLGDSDKTEEEMQRSISRRVYKGTDCGAWVSYQETGVKVGSIVEGCDYGTGVYELTYPFDIKEFWGKLTEVEEDATRIWNETHGCEDCYPDNSENTIVNPDCLTCEGSGVVI